MLRYFTNFIESKKYLVLASFLITIILGIVLTPATLTITHGHLSVIPSTAQAILGYDLKQDLIIPLFAFLGTLIISFGALILALAGAVFDILMDWTIINFAQHMQDLKIISNTSGSGGATGLGSVEIVWQAFRDITNIVIIGMFIFVGISTILGIDEYGYKKFIHRLLIVAILINFSLFFTKVGIDISHTLSGQFYKAIGVTIDGTINPTAGAQGDPASGAAGNNLVGAKGIAGAFINAVGIGTTFKAQSEQLKVIGKQTDSTLMVLWVSIITMAFLIALAIVFFYGAFLLGTRGVLLIFLMMSSSFAFGAFMMPKFRDHDYGWKGWIDTFLRSVIFAPLFMLFLWLVFIFLKQIPSTDRSNIAGFATNASDPKVWSSTIVFLIAIGLLYVAMKVAKSFSSNVAIMGSSFKLGNMAAAGGRDSYLFARNRLRYQASNNAQKVLNSGEKDRLIARANAGGIGGFNAQLQLNRLQKQAKGEFGGATAAVTKKLDNFAKTFTEGAGKGGAAAREAEHEKHEVEKVEKGMSLMEPSKEAQKKVLDAGIQEVKTAAKAEYEQALKDHKSDRTAIKKQEKDLEEAEKELTVITKKGQSGASLSKEDIEKKQKLAMDIKAIGSKIAMTNAAIRAETDAKAKGISFAEAIDDHVEKTLEQTHGEQLKRSISFGNKSISEMKENSKDQYLTRSVPDRIKRDQFRSSLKKKADDNDLKKLAAAFAKKAEAEKPVTPAATPAAGATPTTPAPTAPSIATPGGPPAGGATH